MAPTLFPCYLHVCQNSCLTGGAYLYSAGIDTFLFYRLGRRSNVQPKPQGRDTQRLADCVDRRWLVTKVGSGGRTRYCPTHLGSILLPTCWQASAADTCHPSQPLGPKPSTGASTACRGPRHVTHVHLHRSLRATCFHLCILPGGLYPSISAVTSRTMIDEALAALAPRPVCSSSSMCTCTR